MHVNFTNTGYLFIKTHRRRGKKMQAYIKYLKDEFSTHPHFKVTERVLELLDYIENNIDHVVTQIGKKDLIRHPTNHLSFHLNSYTNAESAKKDLLNLVQEVKACLDDLISLDPKIGIAVTSLFLYNINDADTGCMEARLRPALDYYALYKSTGGVRRFDDWMFEFNNTFQGNFNIKNLIEFFSDKVDYRLPVLHHQETVAFSWDLIKNYQRDIMDWDTIDDDWLHARNELAQPKIEIYQGNRTLWVAHHFMDEKSAQLYLSYVKSILPQLDQCDLAKITIKNTKGNYFFRLTEVQYIGFQQLTKENVVQKPDSQIKKT